MWFSVAVPVGTLRLSGDLNATLADPELRSAFEANVTSELAARLGLRPDQIEVRAPPS